MRGNSSKVGERNSSCIPTFKSGTCIFIPTLGLNICTVILACIQIAILPYCHTSIPSCCPQSFRRDQLHPFANPPADFELKPHDFDIDAELIPADPNQSTGFMLRAKEDPNGMAGSCTVFWSGLYMYVQLCTCQIHMYSTCTLHLIVKCTGTCTGAHTCTCVCIYMYMYIHVHVHLYVVHCTCMYT